MIQVSRKPTLVSSATDVLEGSIDRAGEAIEAVIKQAQDVAEQAQGAVHEARGGRPARMPRVDAAAIEAAIESSAREMLARFDRNQPERIEPATVHGDRTRLQLALLVGIVVLLASAIALLLLRRRSRARPERQGTTPSSSHEEPSDQPAG